MVLSNAQTLQKVFSHNFNWINENVLDKFWKKFLETKINKKFVTEFFYSFFQEYNKLPPTVHFICFCLSKFTFSHHFRYCFTFTFLCKSNDQQKQQQQQQQNTTNLNKITKFGAKYKIEFG